MLTVIKEDAEEPQQLSPAAPIHKATQQATKVTSELAMGSCCTSTFALRGSSTRQGIMLAEPAPLPLMAGKCTGELHFNRDPGNDPLGEITCWPRPLTTPSWYLLLGSITVRSAKLMALLNAYDQPDSLEEWEWIKPRAADTESVREDP